jgi:DNA polymerase/3'-5' exonuclease PolX
VAGLPVQLVERDLLGLGRGRVRAADPLRGGNPYRSKAYSSAADSLPALAVPLEQLIAEGRLTEISGVGGAAFRASKLRKQIPAGLLEFARGSGA